MHLPSFWLTRPGESFRNAFDALLDAALRQPPAEIGMPSSRSPKGR